MDNLHTFVEQELLKPFRVVLQASATGLLHLPRFVIYFLIYFFLMLFRPFFTIIMMEKNISKDESPSLFGDIPALVRNIASIMAGGTYFVLMLVLTITVVNYLIHLIF